MWGICSTRRRLCCQLWRRLLLLFFPISNHISHEVMNNWHAHRIATKRFVTYQFECSHITHITRQFGGKMLLTSAILTVTHVQIVRCNYVATKLQDVSRFWKTILIFTIIYLFAALTMWDTKIIVRLTVQTCFRCLCDRPNYNALVIQSTVSWCKIFCVGQGQ